MSEIRKNFRLFPGLIIVLVGALMLKVVSISTGLQDIFSESSVIAQDADAGENDKPQDDADDDNKPSTAPPSAPELNNQEDIELLIGLRRRREELDARENAIKLKETVLETTENRINVKITQLSEMESNIQKMLDAFTAEEKRKLESLVGVYEKMDPKKSAPIFESLGLCYQVAMVKEMNPTKVSAMMARMNIEKARVLTTTLAQVAQAPELGKEPVIPCEVERQRG